MGDGGHQIELTSGLGKKEMELLRESNWKLKKLCFPLQLETSSPNLDLATVTIAFQKALILPPICLHFHLHLARQRAASKVNGYFWQNGMSESCTDLTESQHEPRGRPSSAGNPQYRALQQSPRAWGPFLPVHTRNNIIIDCGRQLVPLTKIANRNAAEERKVFLFKWDEIWGSIHPTLWL